MISAAIVAMGAQIKGSAVGIRSMLKLMIRSLPCAAFTLILEAISSCR